ncbi:MAG: hypothetical protein II817_00540 [Bacteroidales bacterium]|nr:hypothetical protein [Bacteroidales bacterium]
MGFNDAMLRGVLKMVPQSVVDGVPELIVNAVNARIKAAKCEVGENPAVMIFPGETDCLIQIVAINEQDEIRYLEQYGGKEFIGKLIKEAGNG